MAAPLKAGIPPGLDFTSDYVIQFTALSPTTGAVDTGVVISSASLLVDNLGGGDLAGGFQNLPPVLEYAQEPETPAQTAAGAIGAVLPGGGGL